MSRIRKLSLALVLAATATVVAACSSVSASSSDQSAHRAQVSHARSRAGTADVALAGSLLTLDNEVVGPQFHRATGYAYRGRGGGSIGLANEIAAGEIHPDVFESVGTAPISRLQPRFTKWSVQIASSPLVLAYNPHSPYAATFQAVAAGDKPLSKVFEAMGSPNFLLGRTNPATDPQGQAFVMMMELAQSYLHLPAGTIRSILGPGVPHGQPGKQSQIFSETSLDAHLEAGELDAASAFLSQAVELHLDYIRLPAAIDFGDPADASQYAKASISVPGATQGTTVTVHGTPLTIDVTTISEPGETLVDREAASAFIDYLLSPAGRASFSGEGYSLVPERIFGTVSAVPAIIRSALRSAG